MDTHFHLNLPFQLLKCYVLGKLSSGMFGNFLAQSAFSYLATHTEPAVTVFSDLVFYNYDQWRR